MRKSRRKGFSFHLVPFNVKSFHTQMRKYILNGTAYTDGTIGVVYLPHYLSETSVWNFSLDVKLTSVNFEGRVCDTSVQLISRS